MFLTTFMPDISEKQQKIRDLFIELKQAYQTDYPDLASYQLKFSQTKTVLGSCHYKKRLISISLSILKQNPVELQLDTLKHEFAHALAFMHGERGHGRVWKAWAVKLGATPKSRSHKPVRTEYKYQLIRKQGERIEPLARKYHRKVNLKNRYLGGDKSSLNQLYLISVEELEAYQAGHLHLAQLNFLQ